MRRSTKRKITRRIRRMVRGRTMLKSGGRSITGRTALMGMRKKYPGKKQLIQRAQKQIATKMDWLIL